MTTSRLFIGALLLCALPSFAQTDLNPPKVSSYSSISPEQAAQLFELKPIKLHFRSVTVKNALEEVGRQTGVAIATEFDQGDLLTRTLSLDIETNSFRKATDAIFEEAGAVTATLEKFDANDRLYPRTLNETQGSKDAPTSGTGLFTFRLCNLSTYLSKGRELGAAPARVLNAASSSGMNASVLLDTDPRLPLIGTRIEVTRAEDDKGRSLLAQGGRPNFNQSRSAIRSINLRVPEEDARLLTHLEGQVTYVLASKQETWKVPNLLNAKDLEHDFQAGNSKIHFSVIDAQKVKGGVQIGLLINTITSGTSSLEEMRHPLMQFGQLVASIQIVDAEGRKLETNGFSGGGGDELRGRMDYFLPGALTVPVLGDQPIPPPAFSEPLTLIVNSPTEFVQTEVPFSFSNLPLP